MPDPKPTQGDLFFQEESPLPEPAPEPFVCRRGRKARKKPALTEEFKAEKRRLYREAAIAGLCAYCRKEAPLPGARRCVACQQKQNTYQNSRRQGVLRSELLKARRQESARRKAEGICAYCPEKAIKGRYACEPCQQQVNDACRAKREANRKAGLCPCGKACRSGYVRCEACDRKGRRHNAQRADRAMAAGICRRCQKVPALSGYVMCHDCLDHMLSLGKARAERNLAKGMCGVCGKAPHMLGRTRCRLCYLKALSHQHLGTTKRWAELEAIFQAQGGRCPYSGLGIAVGADAEIDHIVPVSAGGPSEIGNLQWVHTVVNTMKGSRSEDDFLRMVAEIARHRNLLPA